MQWPLIKPQSCWFAGPCINVKTFFLCIGMPVMKMIPSRDRVILMTGNTLVRRENSYTETAPWFPALFYCHRSWVAYLLNWGQTSLVYVLTETQFMHRITARWHSRSVWLRGIPLWLDLSVGAQTPAHSGLQTCPSSQYWKVTVRLWVYDQECKRGVKGSKAPFVINAHASEQVC